MTIAADYITDFFDLVLPKICPGCDKPIKKNSSLICNDCLDLIVRVDEERVAYEYERDFEKDRFISGFIVPFLFVKGTPIQQIIHALKYQKKFLIGKELGRLLAINKINTLTEWNADLILPIPLNRVKKNERGFNQSDFIAKGISLILYKPLVNNAVKRIKYTESQTKIKRADRYLNIKDAFKVSRASIIKDKKILLVDDLITTGATVNECAKSLLKAGASEVYLACICLAD